MEHYQYTGNEKISEVYAVKAVAMGWEERLTGGGVLLAGGEDDDPGTYYADQSQEEQEKHEQERERIQTILDDERMDPLARNDTERHLYSYEEGGIRERLNGPLPKTVEDIDEEGFVKVPASQATYHDNREGKPEIKAVHPDGREVVFDGETGERITTGPLRGTINFAPVDDPTADTANMTDAEWVDFNWRNREHFFKDIAPFYDGKIPFTQHIWPLSADEGPMP